MFDDGGMKSVQLHAKDEWGFPEEGVERVGEWGAGG